MQSFACLLFAGLVLSLSTGEGSAQCVNHGHIKDASSSLSRCDQLYTLLEEALVSSSENLFALRRTFYPQTGLPAPLLCVNYNITSDEELVANGSTNIQITIKRSTSSLFSVINPYVLLEFVSGYILLFVERNLHAEQMTILLDISMTAPMSATEHEIIETLEILTTRLEAYAEEQGKLSDWDGSGRGYTWEYEYLSLWFWLFLIGDSLLAIFAIALAPQIYLTLKKIVQKKISDKKTAQKQAAPPNVMSPKQEPKKDNPIFYIFVLVLGVICLIEFVCSIYITARAASICPTKSCQEEVIPTRIAIICFIAVVGIVGSFIFGLGSGKLSGKELFRDKFKHSFKEFFTIAGFFSLFVYLAVNVFPTIILAFIFPFEVITGIVYLPMIGIIVLLYTEVCSYITSQWNSNDTEENNKQNRSDEEPKDSRCTNFRLILHWLQKDRYTNFRLILHWLLNIVILILFVSATTLIFVFSFTVHNAEVHPSVVSTLIPPIILFLLTTLAKKFVIDKYDPPQTVNIKECATDIPIRGFSELLQSNRHDGLGERDAQPLITPPLSP